MRGRSCTHILLFNTTAKNISLHKVSNITHIPSPLSRDRKHPSQEACRADYEVLRTSVFSNSKSSERTFQLFILIEEITFPFSCTVLDVLTSVFLMVPPLTLASSQFLREVLSSIYSCILMPSDRHVKYVPSYCGILPPSASLGTFAYCSMYEWMSTVRDLGVRMRSRNKFTTFLLHESSETQYKEKYNGFQETSSVTLVWVELFCSCLYTVQLDPHGPRASSIASC